jgi:hypothetical protein
LFRKEIHEIVEKAQIIVFSSMEELKRKLRDSFYQWSQNRFEIKLRQMLIILDADIPAKMDLPIEHFFSGLAVCRRDK